MTPEDELVILRNDMQKTREAVIRMEGKMDLLISTLSTHDNALEDHEQRLRELEKSRWPLAQISVLLSFLAVAATILIPILL
jgi:type IV secretory pathway component VirB8